MPAKKNKAILIITAAMAILTPLILWANPTNPPLARTGAPGESTCASCHNGGIQAGSVSLVFSGGTTYTPGVQQQVTVTITDPDAVAWGYARAASALGVDIIENCEVTGILKSGNRVTGVQTSRGKILGGKIGIAVAGHSSQVARMAGLKLPVESHLLQAFVTEPVKPMVHHVVSWGAELFYLSQSDKGGMVFGGHIDGFNNYTQRGQYTKVKEIMECAVTLIPFMARLRLLRHWAGIQDMTPDGAPFICTTPVDGLYLNGGWCYQGFKATPASGLTFAHTIAMGEAHELNKGFELERMMRGDTLDEHGTGLRDYRQ